MNFLYFSFFFLIDDSYFELLFVSKKLNIQGAGVSVKTKKSKLDKDNKLDFSTSKIEFMSINMDEDYIDVFLLHNNIKIQSEIDSPNYFRIMTKDIGVNNDFKLIKFTVVNDIPLEINIRFKNKFSTQSMSM